MKNGKTIEKLTRGWLPKEPILLYHHRPLERNIPFMVWWLTAAAIAGVASGAGLIVLGDFLGLTSGYSAYFWYVAVAICAWDIAGFTAVYGYVKRRRAMGRDKV